MVVVLLLVANSRGQQNTQTKKKEDEFLEELSLGRQDVFQANQNLRSNTNYLGQMDTVFKGIHTIDVQYYNEKALREQVPTKHLHITLDTACRILQESKVWDGDYQIKTFKRNEGGFVSEYRTTDKKNDYVWQWMAAEKAGDSSVRIIMKNGQIESKEHNIRVDSTLYVSLTFQRKDNTLVLSEKDTSVWGKEEGVVEHKDWRLDKRGNWRPRYRFYEKIYADSSIERRQYMFDCKTGNLTHIRHELFNKKGDLYRQYRIDEEGKEHPEILVDFDYMAGTYIKKRYDHKGREFLTTGIITNACTPRKQNETRQYADKDGKYDGERSRTYDETADCKTRVVEHKNRKGVVTSRTITTLDSQDRPVLSQTFDASNKLKAQTVYTYTDF